MESPKDYEIHLFIKNARLINKINEFNFDSIREFADVSGISYSGICKALRLETSVYNKKFHLRTMPRKLAEFFMCEPTELFPEEIWYAALTETYKSVQITSEELHFYLPSERGGINLLEKQLDEEKVMGLVGELLTGRETKVLKMRFIGGNTYEEVGREFGVSRERIRQIETKALRKLRHPSRAELIREYLH